MKSGCPSRGTRLPGLARGLQGSSMSHLPAATGATWGQRATEPLGSAAPSSGHSAPQDKAGGQAARTHRTRQQEALPLRGPGGCPGGCRSPPETHSGETRGWLRPASPGFACSPFHGRPGRSRGAAQGAFATPASPPLYTSVRFIKLTGILPTGRCFPSARPPAAATGSIARMTHGTPGTG